MTWYVHVQDLITQGELAEVLMVFRKEGNVIERVKPLVFERADSGSFPYDEATFKASLFGMGVNRHSQEICDLLQALADAAWELGVKPRQCADNASELKATKYHLEDMRKLSKVAE